jgi:hypothetical protein
VRLSRFLIKIGLSSVGDVANVVKISERLFELERTLVTYPLGYRGLQRPYGDEEEGFSQAIGC